MNIYLSIYLCSYLFIYVFSYLSIYLSIYHENTSSEQEGMQGKRSLTDLILEFPYFYLSCHAKVKDPSQHYYLPIDFLNLLALREM